MNATPGFLGFPARLPEDRAPAAVIFGAGHGSAYAGRDSAGRALAPADLDGLSALTAARLLVNAIGTVVRQR